MDVRVVWWAICSCLLVWHCQPPGPKTGGPPVRLYPASGEVSPGTRISLQTEAGAQIFFTTDETTPTLERGQHYTGAFALWGSTTLRAVAVDPQGRYGPEVKAQFQVDTLLPQTQVSPLGGNFRRAIRVSLETDPDARTYYTLNGTDPTLRSPLYREPLAISGDSILRFFSIDAAGNRELIQQQVYNFPPIIEVEPPGGLYDKEGLEIRILTNEKATISYRLLDGTPASSYQRYEKPFTLTRDTRVEILAIDPKRAAGEKVVDYAFVRPLQASAQDLQLLQLKAMAVVDLEGLGTPRLVLASKGSLVTREFEGGGWKQPVLLSALSFEPAWLRCWDLDGDGISDVLLGDAKGRLHTFRGVSGLEVKADQGLLAPWSAASAQLVAAVPLDADADGQLDIFLLDRRAGQSRILRRTPQGYALQKSFSPAIAAGAVGALAGDFDKNDRPDLLILPGGDGLPYLLYATDEPNTYRKKGLKSELPQATTGSQIQWLHAARSDWDNDGDLDLILVGRGILAAPGGTPANSPSLIVALVERLVGQQWKPGSILPLADAKLRGLQVVDIDADGYPDLLLQQAPPSPPVVLKNLLGRKLIPLPPPAPDASFRPGLAAAAAEIASSGVASALWIQPDGALFSLRRKAPSPPSWTFLRLVLRGIQGNRNAIGTRISTRTSDYRVRLREIGLRSTGPDQSALFVPLHFADPKHIGALTLTWSDGQSRTLPAPDTNTTLFLAPH